MAQAAFAAEARRAVQHLSALWAEAPPLARTYGEVVVAAFGFWVLEMVLIWLLTGPLLRLLRTDKRDKKAKTTATLAVARITGAIHNAIQIPLGLILLLDPHCYNDRITGTTPLSRTTMLISAGFFGHDLIMCLKRFASEGPLYTFHAAVCHAAYTFAIHTGFLHYHGAAFLMWELSTPFVHLRWFMHKMKLDHTQGYLVNGFLMIAAFFFARIVWGYYAGYLLVMDVVGERYKVPASPFPVWGTVAYCLVAIAMNSLNSFWFWKMADRALQVLRGKSGSEVSKDKDE